MLYHVPGDKGAAMFLKRLISAYPLARYNLQDNELADLAIKKIPTYRYYAANGEVKEFYSQDEVRDFVDHHVD